MENNTDTWSKAERIAEKMRNFLKKNPDAWLEKKFGKKAA